MKDDRNMEFSESVEFSAPLDEYSAPLKEFHTHTVPTAEKKKEGTGFAGKRNRLLRQFFLLGVIAASSISLLWSQEPQEKLDLSELVPIYREIQGYVENAQRDELDQCLIQNQETLDKYTGYNIGFDGENCFVIEGKSDFAGMIGTYYHVSSDEYFNYWFAVGDYSGNSINGKVISCYGGIITNSSEGASAYQGYGYADWEGGQTVGMARLENYSKYERDTISEYELIYCIEGMLGTGQDFTGLIQITGGNGVSAEIRAEDGTVVIDELIYDGRGDTDRNTAAVNANGKPYLFLDEGMVCLAMDQIGVAWTAPASQNDNIVEKPLIPFYPQDRLRTVLDIHTPVVKSPMISTETNAPSDTAEESPTVSDDMSSGDSQQESSEYVSESTVLNNALEALSCDSFAGGNGNVIPIERNGLWGAVDYSGREILACEYADLYYSPNNHGYFILVDAEGMNCVFSPEGELVYRTSNSVCISGNGNYILDMYEGTGGDYDLDYEYKYLDTSGNVLFTTGRCTYNWNEYQEWAAERGASVVNSAGKGATPYNGDRAVVFDGAFVYLLGAEGTVLKTMDAPYMDSARMQYYGGTQYYVMTGSWGEVIYDTDAEEYVRSEKGLDVDLMASFALGMDYGTFWQYQENFNINYTGFYQDGYTHFVNDRLMCCTVLDAAGEQKSILFDAKTLFDLTDMDYSQCIIAVYDTIIFDDTPYMAAKENGQWFFITQDGTVAGNRTYQDASAFNYQGYALVIEDGIAYMIDERFEIVEEFGPADRVYCTNELLVYVSDGVYNVICPS